MHDGAARIGAGRGQTGGIGQAGHAQCQLFERHGDRWHAATVDTEIGARKVDLAHVGHRLAHDGLRRVVGFQVTGRLDPQMAADGQEGGMFARTVVVFGPGLALGAVEIMERVDVGRILSAAFESLRQVAEPEQPFAHGQHVDDLRAVARTGKRQLLFGDVECL